MLNELFSVSISSEGEDGKTHKCRYWDLPAQRGPGPKQCKLIDHQRRRDQGEDVSDDEDNEDLNFDEDHWPITTPKKVRPFSAQYPRLQNFHKLFRLQAVER